MTQDTEVKKCCLKCTLTFREAKVRNGCANSTCDCHMGVNTSSDLVEEIRIEFEKKYNSGAFHSSGLFNSVKFIPWLNASLKSFEAKIRKDEQSETDTLVKMSLKQGELNGRRLTVNEIRKGIKKIAIRKAYIRDLSLLSDVLSLLDEIEQQKI